MNSRFFHTRRLFLLFVSNIKAELADGVAASRFKDVPDAGLRNSPNLQK